MAKKPLVQCKFCGTVGRAKSQWRGSRYFERFLWLTLLFPGPIYTWWRWAGRRQVCARCGSENIIPATPLTVSPDMHKALQDEKFGYEEHRF